MLVEDTSARLEDPLIGALLRAPAQAIHRRVIRELNDAGFDELRLPHIPVLQYPGPDGVRPAALAERTGMSKQAINQLLRSLEGSGYLVRSDVAGEAGARVIRFTERGHAAFQRIVEIQHAVERDWRAELGAEDFATLKRLLTQAWANPKLG
mgnify:FL=1